MHMIHALRDRTGSAGERGFTLIELMIAVGLSLMILAGLVTVFVNNSNTRKEIERTTRQIENGRYGIELLSNNLIIAGFYSEFDPTILPTPGSVPTACSKLDPDIQAGLALPVQGYRSATMVTLPCLTDLKEGTDVVVVRRTSTCVAGTTDCDAVTADAYFFQASLCNPTIGNEELASPTITDYYRLNTDTSALDRHKRTCSTTNCLCSTAALADIRRYHTDIYFVANNSVGTDGIPTLKRAELTPSTASGWTIVPLVEGVENLKFEYGIDADGNGMPESYTPTPGTAADWRNVTSVKIYLLAKNTEPSPGFANNKDYTLDSATTVNGGGDAYRRHVFNTTVKLANVAGRRGI